MPRTGARYDRGWALPPSACGHAVPVTPGLGPRPLGVAGLFVWCSLAAFRDDCELWRSGCTAPCAFCRKPCWAFTVGAGGGVACAKEAILRVLCSFVTARGLCEYEYAHGPFRMPHGLFRCVPYRVKWGLYNHLVWNHFWYGYGSLPLGRRSPVGAAHWVRS